MLSAPVTLPPLGTAAPLLMALAVNNDFNEAKGEPLAPPLQQLQAVKRLQPLSPGSRNVVMSMRGGFAPLNSESVTVLGAFANVLLSLLKLVVGTLSGSASLVADAYHSGSDLLVDAVTFVAVKAPPAFERVATLAIAALLASAGGVMTWSSSVALWKRNVPTEMLGTPPLLVAAVAIIAKEMLYRITYRVGVRTRQAVLLASAKHHRSDAMSSLAAAVGAGGVLVGLPEADMIAAAVVGGMMFAMGVDVARGGDHDE